MNLDTVVEHVLAGAGDRRRFIVMIAGAPGSGKSTLAARLTEALNAARAASACLMPMDGYHLDNAVLRARGLLARKGAPQTFDVDGLLSAIRRIAAGETVVVPVFDRKADLARAGARVVPAAVPIVVLEGNYLQLDAPGWREVAGLADMHIFLEVDRCELERRLRQRWIDHGMDAEAAQRRARENDLVNAELVCTRRIDCAAVTLGEADLGEAGLPQAPRS